jgi:hypothetical protein
MPLAGWGLESEEVVSRSLFLCGISSILVSSSARAETYDVGPGKPYGTLSEVVGSLAAGDIVQIHGGATYTEDVTLDASGTADAKITIRGVPVNGERPVLSGSLHIDGDHVVLEGLEIRDGEPMCLRHGGHDLTVLDTVVHDCPSHGILGTDVGSGSLTLERVEVYNCASVQTGNRKHQVYIATDEVAHPGSVFRMALSYVHDCGFGGSNIKSRAERTELYSNWIADSGLYEVELYGPDQDGVPSGWSEDLAREDADVVGNVFYRSANQDTDFLFRVGGDGAPDLGDAGPNDSKGRVRFACNTVIAPGGTGIFRTFNRVDSIELHNNVFFGEGGLQMLSDEATWVGGSQLVTGTHNWLSEGTSDVPEGWEATLTGTDPQLVDLGAVNLYPIETSVLVDAGVSPTVSPSGHEFPNPLQVPFSHPPPANTPRPVVGAVDIGAFEYGVADTPPPPPEDPSNASSDEDDDTSDGGCQLGLGRSSRWLVSMALLLILAARRRSLGV